MTHALVTGASGGIGAAIAHALARRGVTLVLHYQAARAGVESLLRDLPGTGHVPLQADLADTAGAGRLWAEASSGRHVDILINNAGVFPNHPPLSSDYAQWTAAWQRTLAINLFGPACLSHLAANAMAKRGTGRIVSISSRGAFRGEPNAPAYAASKAGLNALSQSLAKALAASGVFVYAVAPGWVSTARVAATVKDAAVLADQPLGRVATPQEVAEVTSWCALDAPASMTGAIIDVNGASYLRS
jgi:3-oxoacyl-[acyl-carrier protein] reductase